MPAAGGSGVVGVMAIPAMCGLLPASYGVRMTILVIEPLNVAFADLRPGMCKYECSEAIDTPTNGFRFCGRQVAFPGAPYCAFHMGVAIKRDVR